MKYILINDILSFFKKFFKLILSFFILLISVLLVQILIGNVIDIEFFENIIGLNSNIEDGLFPTLMFLLNLGFHLVMIFQIFNNDIKNGTENILLRINMSKWILYKFISIFLLNNLFRIVVYLCTIIVLFIFGKVFPFEILLKCYFINIIFIFFIDSIFLIIYGLTKKKTYLLSIFILILVICIDFLFINVSFLTNQIYIFIILTVILLLIFYFLIKKRYINILE